MVSPGPLTMALAVMALTAGVVLIVAGSRGVLPHGPDRSSPARAARPAAERSEVVLRLVLGLAGFAGGLVITRWPVVAVFLAVSGVLLPTLARAKRQRRAAVARVEAIATWAESLRDVMSASAGIHEALRISAKVAPEPIRAEVQDLAVRLQHETVSNALRRFATDMAHPLSDMVVASLIMASGRHAGSLQDVLTVTARNARDTATMWRQVESGRSRVYSQTRLAGWVSFIICTFFILTRREFLDPFDTVGGQVALVVICGAFFGSGVALHQLSKPVPPKRVFRGIERWTGEEPVAPLAGQVPA